MTMTIIIMEIRLMKIFRISKFKITLKIFGSNWLKKISNLKSQKFI